MIHHEHTRMNTSKTILAHPAYWVAFLFFAIGFFESTQIAAQKLNQKMQLQLKDQVLKPAVNDKVTIQRFENNALQVETAAAASFQFKANETYVIRTDDKKINSPDESAYNKMNPEVKSMFALKDIQVLPEKFVQTGAVEGSELIYSIGFESRRPLEYVFSARQFLGSMKFFLISESPSGNEQLTEPVLIEIVSDDIDAIDPVSREIDHVSIPLTEIALQGPDLSDSAQVKIITKSNPKGYETFIKVEPAIEMKSSRRSFQGLGVQKIPISVRVMGSSARDSVKVSFNVEQGTVIPNAVYVHYQSPSIVELRSEGLGTAKLTTSAIFTSNELEFQYIFPWLFILMAIAGGVIGGLAKYFTNQEKLTLLKSLLKGVVMGFFGAVVYYVLGFSLLEFEVSDIFNEFAVLGFSALVAFFGVRAPG